MCINTCLSTCQDFEKADTTLRHKICMNSVSQPSHRLLECVQRLSRSERSAQHRWTSDIQFLHFLLKLYTLHNKLPAFWCAFFKMIVELLTFGTMSTALYSSPMSKLSCKKKRFQLKISGFYYHSRKLLHRADFLTCDTQCSLK